MANPAPPGWSARGGPRPAACYLCPVADADDELQDAFASQLPRIKKLRWALLAALAVVLLANLLGWIDASWQLILWLAATVAVLPPLLTAVLMARHLRDPGETRREPGGPDD